MFNPTETTGLNGPWPATPFEWYMLEDHSTQQPMTFTICFACRGTLDPQLLKQAFLKAVESHPLLTSIAVPLDAWPRYEWRPQQIDSSALVDPIDAVLGLPKEKVRECGDPRRGPACRLRIYLEQQSAPEEDQLWTIAIEFHHSVADGIRSLEFCSDFFRHYGDLNSQAPNRLASSAASLVKRDRKEIDAGLLAERGMMDRAIPYPVSRLTAVRFMWWELSRFVFALPARIHQIVTPKRNSQIEPQEEKSDWVNEVTKWEAFGLTSLEFCPELTKDLRDYAHAHGGTLNHVLLATTLRAFATAQNSWLKRIRTWVVVLPVNMVRVTRKRIPCHNGIGYAFLRRKHVDCLDWKSNFTTLKTEIDAIQDWKLGGLFLDALDQLQRIPRTLAKWIIRGSKPGSFVWSYVGDPTRRFPHRLVENGRQIMLGDSRLEGLSAAPPTRRGTELAILVTLWQDSIRLCIRVNEQKISKEHASQIRRLIASEILAIANTIRSETTNSQPSSR